MSVEMIFFVLDYYGKIKNNVLWSDGALNSGKSSTAIL